MATIPARARATRNSTRIISIVFPTPPDDSSETTIIPTAVHTGADPNQGRAEAMLHQRNEGPRRVEAARLRAVDAALAGWRSDSLLERRPPFAGGLPSESGPALPLSRGLDRDLLRDRQMITPRGP